MDAESPPHKKVRGAVETEPRSRRVPTTGRVGLKIVAAAREEWLALSEQARRRHGSGCDEEPGDDIRVLVAHGVHPRFCESAADESAHCSFLLEANGDLWIIKVPTDEHWSMLIEVGAQLRNYCDALPGGLSALVSGGVAVRMHAAGGRWREPDVMLTPKYFPPGAAELARVIVEIEHSHRSPHKVREDGDDLLNAGPEVRALVSVSLYRRPSPAVPAPQRFAAAAVMWRKMPAGGIVVADAVSFGTDELETVTKNQFAAAAFPGVVVPLLPPVPNVAFVPPAAAAGAFVPAGAAGWRRVARAPVGRPVPAPPPGHHAVIHIPAADVLFNVWDPAAEGGAGAFAPIPAVLPDAVLDLWALVANIPI